MICEILGAVECLAICVINMAANSIGPTELAGGFWLLGIVGLALAGNRRAT